MPLFSTRRRAVVPTTTTTTRRPSLVQRLMHPTPTTASSTRGVTTRSRKPLFARRTKATGPAPISTHRRARTKPTLGSRIHGMARRLAGTLMGDRGKKRSGVVMQKGVAPGSRRRRHL